MARVKLETYKTWGKQPYGWRMRVAKNGEIIASGEKYADKRNRDNAVEIVRDGRDISIVEVRR